MRKIIVTDRELKIEGARYTEDDWIPEDREVFEVSIKGSDNCLVMAIMDDNRLTTCFDCAMSDIRQSRRCNFKCGMYGYTFKDLESVLEDL